MKNKEEAKKEEIPLLVHNLLLMKNYPHEFGQGHWDILAGTMRMIFNKFPEINAFLATHEIDEKDQKYFDHKLKDLMPLARGDI